MADKVFAKNVITSETKILGIGSMTEEQKQNIGSGVIKLYCPNTACNVEMQYCCGNKLEYFCAKAAEKHAKGCPYANSGNSGLPENIDPVGSTFNPNDFLGKLMSAAPTTTPSGGGTSGKTTSASRTKAPSSTSGGGSTPLRNPRSVRELYLLLSQLDVGDRYGKELAGNLIADERTLTHMYHSRDEMTRMDGVILVVTHNPNLFADKDTKLICMSKVGDKTISFVLQFSDYKTYAEAKKSFYNKVPSAPIAIVGQWSHCPRTTVFPKINANSYLVHIKSLKQIWKIK